MFDKFSGDLPSFGAWPRRVWMVLGILELVRTIGLIAPTTLRWHLAPTREGLRIRGERASGLPVLPPIPSLTVFPGRPTLVDLRS